MKYVVVYPSKLNKLGYCPRQLYFEIFSPIKPKSRVRIRMLYGKTLHTVRRAFKRGIKEELIRVEIPELEVLLVGRPDNYEVFEDYILLEEFKTSRMGKGGAWLGDMLQVMAYSYMLEKKYKKRVKSYIVYVNGKVEVPSQKELLFKYLKLYKEIVGGFLPEKKREREKCESKCQYVELCH